MLVRGVFAGIRVQLMQVLRAYISAVRTYNLAQDKSIIVRCSPMLLPMHMLSLGFFQLDNIKRT